jgi:hypothetical protein
MSINPTRAIHILIFCLGYNFCIGQKIFFSQSDSIFTIKLDDCSVSALFKSDRWTDIAISPDGTFYGVRSNKIYEIDSSGNTSLIHELPIKGFNSLAINYNNVAYTVGNTGDLYSYNLISGEEDSLFSIDYPSSGDVTFNEGYLWMSSPSDKFVKIDIATGEHSLEIDESFGGNPFAFTSSMENCEGNFGYAGFLQNAEGTTDIHRINFQTNQITKTCSINKRSVFGMASRYEYINSIPTIDSIRIKIVEIINPLCNNSNGRIDFEVGGLYRYLDYELKLNGIVIDSSLRTLDNLTEGNFNLEVSNKLGCKDSVNIILECIQTSSANNITENPNIKIYPNPFESTLIIQHQNSRIRHNLHSIDGERVDHTFHSNPSETILNFDPKIDSGIYILKFNNRTFKILKI